MATLLIKQNLSACNKLKSKQKKTTTTRTTTLFPSTLAQAQHYHYENNDVNNEKGEHCDNANDFYHKKTCYQTTATIIKITKFLNQRRKRRRNNNNNTTTVTISPIPANLGTLSYGLNSLLSYICRCSFVTMLLMMCLLLLHSLAMAAPQSCILCDKNDLLAKDPQTNYEEFLFEHQVTRQDAINALRQLNESFYEGMASDSSCNAVRCTDKVMKYCLGPQFINDHCWCELGHSTEGLPFVPHICYVGEKVYKTSVGSCFFYEEVKECCCSSVLAKELPLY
ncbi:hypothetical protein DOY81_004415 [Sarcophaga bullata]|nr:hypothetical protein DOY81_004415 [Sarcophaga bullata]